MQKSPSQNAKRFSEHQINFRIFRDKVARNRKKAQKYTEKLNQVSFLTIANN